MVSVNEKFRDYGKDCVCPVCGKQWYITDLAAWVLKRDTSGWKHNRTMVYFDKISCMWKYDNDLIEQEIINAKCSSKRNCVKCRYFNVDEYGFYYCTATAIVVNPKKIGCKKWKEREVTDNWSSSTEINQKVAEAAGMIKIANDG